jgi:rhamnose transport system ATP-binding protein
LVLCRPITDNIAMAVNDRLTRVFAGFFNWFLDHGKRRSLVDEMIRRLEIRTADARLHASTLSGGNQQKIVLAKWLATQARVLILDQPTAGIDVGTKSEIYRLLDELSSQGVGIIVISDDPEELSQVSDRVLVMRKGKISNELRGSVTSDRILEAVTAETVP